MGAKMMCANNRKDKIGNDSNADILLKVMKTSVEENMGKKYTQRTWVMISTEQ